MDHPSLPDRRNVIQRTMWCTTYAWGQAGGQRPLVWTAFEPPAQLRSRPESSSALQDFVQSAQLLERLGKAAPSSEAGRWQRVEQVVAEGSAPHFIAQAVPWSLEDYRRLRVPVTDATLRAVTEGILLALRDLRQVAQRPHGRLTSARILLTGLSPRTMKIRLAEPAGETGNKSEVDDLRTMGRILYQLVIGHPYDPTTGVQKLNRWAQLNANGESWREFCRYLLDNSENAPVPTLDEALRRIPRPPRSTTPLWWLAGAAAMVAVVVLVALWTLRGGKTVPTATNEDFDWYKQQKWFYNAKTPSGAPSHLDDAALEKTRVSIQERLAPTGRTPWEILSVSETQYTSPAFAEVMEGYLKRRNKDFADAAKHCVGIQRDLGAIRSKADAFAKKHTEEGKGWEAARASAKTVTDGLIPANEPQLRKFDPVPSEKTGPQAEYARPSSERVDLNQLLVEADTLLALDKAWDEVQRTNDMDKELGVPDPAAYFAGADGVQQLISLLRNWANERGGLRKLAPPLSDKSSWERYHKWRASTEYKLPSDPIEALKCLQNGLPARFETAETNEINDFLKLREGLEKRAPEELAGLSETDPGRVQIMGQMAEFKQINGSDTVLASGKVEYLTKIREDMAAAKRVDDRLTTIGNKTAELVKRILYLLKLRSGATPLDLAVQDYFKGLGKDSSEKDVRDLIRAKGPTVVDGVINRFEKADDAIAHLTFKSPKRLPKLTIEGERLRGQAVDILVKSAQDADKYDQAVSGSAETCANFNELVDQLELLTSCLNDKMLRPDEKVKDSASETVNDVWRRTVALRDKLWSRNERAMQSFETDTKLIRRAFAMNETVARDLLRDRTLPDMNTTFWLAWDTLRDKNNVDAKDEAALGTKVHDLLIQSRRNTVATSFTEDKRQRALGRANQSSQSFAASPKPGQTPPEIEKAAAILVDFGWKTGVAWRKADLGDGDLTPAQYDLMLYSLKSAVESRQLKGKDLSDALANFMKDVESSKEIDGAEAVGALKGKIKELLTKGAASNSDTKLGPERIGGGDGMQVTCKPTGPADKPEYWTYTWSFPKRTSTPVSMDFIQISCDGRPFRISTTTVPIKLIEMLGPDSNWSMEEPVSELTPRGWKWDKDTKWITVSPTWDSPALAGDWDWYPKGMSADPQDTKSLAEKCGGNPHADHPMTHLSPRLASMMARRLGCRLPSHDEWNAAFDYDHRESPAARFRSQALVDTLSARRHTFKQDMAATADGKKLQRLSSLLDIAYKNWGGGVTAEPTIANTDANHLVWFSPVDRLKIEDKSEQRDKLKHMLGNVWQMVVKEPNDKDKAEFLATLERFEQPNKLPQPGKYCAMGGSALTLREDAVDKDGKPKPVQLPADDPDKGWSDVGFRLAFSAADPLEIQFAKALQDPNAKVSYWLLPKR